MDFPIGLQLYSVRDELKEDFVGTLEKVKALGYDGIEFAGLYDRSPEEIKNLVEEIGLIPVSAHIPYEELVSNLEKVLEDYSAIGCKYIVIPYLTEEFRPDKEKFSEVIEAAKTIGKRAKDFGLTLLYHNHDFEFEKINGEYALDILYREVPCDFLEVEPDTCWIKIAGEDPAKYILKYKNRVPVVHLKDYYLKGDKPDKLYELIGIVDESSKEEAKFDFKPVGKGLQDIPAIIESAKESGASWLIVEQDMPSIGMSPLECAQESILYLNSIK